jgi:hypothetical protein
VGLHPAFANPSWVFNIAIPHFSGTDPDEYAPAVGRRKGAKRAALLDLFLRRVHIAVGNLAPRGELPIADGAADGERTVVKVADFVAWATKLPDPWELPEELKRMWPRPEDEERKRWTPDKLAELRAFRDEHGTKAAAKKFGISASRVRQLLQKEPPSQIASALLMPKKRTKR